MLDCKYSSKLVARLHRRIIHQLHSGGIDIRVLRKSIPGEISTVLSVDGVRGLMYTEASASVGILSHSLSPNYAGPEYSGASPEVASGNTRALATLGKPSSQNQSRTAA